MEETHEALAREFTVQNRMGIHTRPAAQIVRLANRYPDVEITVSKDEESVNGKSIMGVMMLAAEHGAIITLRASGPDADHALDALAALVAARFGES